MFFSSIKKDLQKIALHIKLISFQWEIFQFREERKVSSGKKSREVRNTSVQHRGITFPAMLFMG